VTKINQENVDKNILAPPTA